MIPSGGSEGDPNRLAARDASVVECREPFDPWLLTFDGVTVDYGRSRVLSRVSFTCR